MANSHLLSFLLCLTCFAPISRGWEGITVQDVRLTRDPSVVSLHLVSYSKNHTDDIGWRLLNSRNRTVWLDRSKTYAGGSGTSGTCAGVSVEYTVEQVARDDEESIGYSFASSISMVNQGSRTLRDWKLTIGFRNGEILTDVKNGAPQNCPLPCPGAGAVLEGVLLKDLMTLGEAESSKVMESYAVYVGIKGREFWATNKAEALPSSLVLINRGWLCPLLVTAPAKDHRVTSCCIEEKFSSENDPDFVPPALPSVQSSNGFQLLTCNTSCTANDAKKLTLVHGNKESTSITLHKEPENVIFWISTNGNQSLLHILYSIKDDMKICMTVAPIGSSDAPRHRCMEEMASVTRDDIAGPPVRIAPTLDNELVLLPLKASESGSAVCRFDSVNTTLRLEFLSPSGLIDSRPGAKLVYSTSEGALSVTDYKLSKSSVRTFLASDLIAPTDAKKSPPRHVLPPNRHPPRVAQPPSLSPALPSPPPMPASQSRPAHDNKPTLTMSWAFVLWASAVALNVR